MLAKKFRLPSSVVFSHAQSFRENEFSVKIQKNTLPHNRYGFVVSKAIDKKATVRNRVKRVLRSCIEEKWLGRGDKDILFIVRPGIKSAEKLLLREKVDKIMRGLTS
ncbi:MAG TPA: ribonuclease P protein component [Patescibacteria group bacterium]|nr:ribonuclease P protein component [Patescibacteria group bacterium]